MSQYRVRSFLVKTTCKVPDRPIYSEDKQQVGIYRREMVKNLLDGQGIITFYNGDRYKGNSLNRCFHGEGEFKWRNKTKYTGEIFLIFVTLILIGCVNKSYAQSRFETLGEKSKTTFEQTKHFLCDSLGPVKESIHLTGEKLKEAWQYSEPAWEKAAEIVRSYLKDTEPARKTAMDSTKRYLNIAGQKSSEELDSLAAKHKKLAETAKNSAKTATQMVKEVWKETEPQREAAVAKGKELIKEAKESATEFKQGGDKNSNK